MKQKKVDKSSFAETKIDSSTNAQDSQVCQPIAKPNVVRPFAFGEWVLVDGDKSGQIVDFYGNGWYMVDFAGVWERYKDDRITKDERYRSANGV